jgi:hypothetical protein
VSADPGTKRGAAIGGASAAAGQKVLYSPGAGTFKTFNTGGRIAGQIFVLTGLKLTALTRAYREEIKMSNAELQLQVSQLQTKLLETLRALTDWRREHTSPCDANSPLLIRAVEVINEADALRVQTPVTPTPDLVGTLTDALVTAVVKQTAAARKPREERDDVLDVVSYVAGHFVEGMSTLFKLETRIVPLENFESAVASVDFGNGCKLEELTKEELNKIRKAPTVKLPMHAPPRYKLATANPASPFGHDFDATPPASAIEVIRAMRLCHGGHLAAPFFMDYDPGVPVSFIALFLPSIHSYRTPYRLTQGDIKTVQRLVAMLMSARCRSDNRLNNALRRFDDVYGRSRNDDQIIDCFTALESCLTPDSTTEVGYKLALRTAAILSGSRKPKEVQLLINAGYDARSKIIHEGQSLTELFTKGSVKKRIQRLNELRGLSDSITPDSFTDELIEYLRHVLQFVITELSGAHASVEDLVSSLDERIADGLCYVEFFGRADSVL